MTPTYDYPRPALTVDVVLIDRDGRSVLLVRRDAEPFEGAWALPGGFVDEMEPLEDAARRELAEEAGVTVGEMRQLATFGEAGRDPRGWTVTVVWLTFRDGECEPSAGDDAREVAWHPIEELPALAFDHAVIVERALREAGLR